MSNYDQISNSGFRGGGRLAPVRRCSGPHLHRREAHGGGDGSRPHRRGPAGRRVAASRRPASSVAARRTVRQCSSGARWVSRGAAARKQRSRYWAAAHLGRGEVEHKEQGRKGIDPISRLPVDWFFDQANRAGFFSEKENQAVRLVLVEVV